MQKLWIALLLVLYALSGACTTMSTSKPRYMAMVSKQASFEETREAVKIAITDRGMVINNFSYIGNMLKRTGKDLGNNKPVYRHAEALEFCSATVSRAMMEADPHNIVFCPYVIAIYEIADTPGTITIAYRRPQIVGDAQSRESLTAVDKLLQAIVKDAAEW